MTDTIQNGIPFVPESTIDPAAGLNLALKVADALIQVKVQAIQNDPPATPDEGDMYIVGTVPTGAWVGYEGKLAQYLDAGWNFYSGVTAVNLTDSKLYINVAAGWVVVGP